MFTNNYNNLYVVPNFSSILTLLIGIAGVIISGIYFNDACEKNISLILLITSIFLIVTFIAERNLFYDWYVTPNDLNYIVLNVLVVGCVVMTVILSVYTFSVSVRNHYCPDPLYFYSFAACIVLLILSLFVVSYILRSKGRIYTTNRTQAHVANGVRSTPAVNTGVPPIRI